MTMTHKEALEVAVDAYWQSEAAFCIDDMEAAIRAYIEARGLVMVPKKMTWTQNNALNGYCLSAAEANAVYDMALAAAPDPFKDDAL